MRERRRILLADRQIMLARIARREALADLAGAIANEGRSASLAERSRALIEGYGEGADVSDGHALRNRVAMMGALARLAGDADNARRDALRQVERHAALLAGSDNRIKLLENHARSAREALERIEAARERDPAPRLAQKLLKADRPQSRSR